MLHIEFSKDGSGVAAEFLNGPVDALVEGPGVSRLSLSQTGPTLNRFIAEMMTF